MIMSLKATVLKVYGLGADRGRSPVSQCFSSSAVDERHVFNVICDFCGKLRHVVPQC